MTGPWPRHAVAVATCLLALVAAGGAPPAWAQAAPDPELVARGRALFNDPSLSLDDRWSCAACHPGEGHTDNRTYIGLEIVPHGDPRGRSTPTPWGAGTRAAISWAGTASTA
jgi:cytochrome c peroxidase